MWTTHRTPTGNANGHKDYLETLAKSGRPVTVMVTDNFGIATEGISIAKTHNLEEQSTVIYRLTRKGQESWRDPITKQPIDWDVPNYDNNPIEEGNFYFDATMRRLEVEDFDSDIYISFLNEIDKNKSEWLAQFGLQVAKRITEKGLRCILFNWNSGEPEPSSWTKPNMVTLLKYMESNPNVLMGLHEYSFDSDIFNQYPFLVGRFLELEKACNSVGVNFNNIRIAITEFGHGKDHRTFPTQSELEKQTKLAMDLYHNYSNIRVVAHWVISNNPNWGDAGKMVQKLYEPMKEYELNKPPHLWEQENTMPPVSDDYEYFFTGSWYDQYNVQIPLEWDIKILDGCSIESDCKPWNQRAEPEGRHLFSEHLPPNEQHFLNDYGVCYKVFHGSSPFDITFITDKVLKKGKTYKVSIHLTNDFYVWDGKKNPELLDDNHAYIDLGCGDSYVNIKIDKEDYLKEKIYETELEIEEEGQFEFTIGTIWGIPTGSGNNGVFIKGVKVEEMPETETKVRGIPRTTYKKIVVLTHNTIAKDMFLACAETCYEPQVSLMMSADDVGAGSDTDLALEPVGFLRDVHVIVVNPSSWSDSIEDFYSTYYPAVTYREIVATNTTDLKQKLEIEIKKVKGEYIPPNFTKSFPTLFYHINSYYGDDRPWGEHRGTDLRCFAGTPIFAYMSGVVVKANNIPSDSGWGNYVRIAHQDGHESIYAHNEKNLVVEGQLVKNGEPIAIAGSTGNSTGVHLHFELRKNNKWYDNTSIVNEMISNPELSEYFPIAKGFVWNEYIKSARNGNYLVTLNANVRADANSSAHSFGVIYKGQVAKPTGIQRNGYIEVECHIIDYKPIKTNLKFGLHASTTPETSIGAINIMKEAGGDVVKVLSNITPQSMLSIVNNINPEMYIVRAFLDFGNRIITPQQFVNDTILDVKRTLSYIPIGKEFYIELHNEPNLSMEGMGRSWNNPTEFSSWISHVLSLYKNLIPNGKFLYPAMSPGFAYEQRQYHLDYYKASKPILKNFDGVAVHSYWSNDTGFYGSSESGILLLKTYAQELSGNKLFVTEASNNIGYDFSSKGTQYKSFLMEISSLNLPIEAVTFFVVEALDGTFASEVWYNKDGSTGIVETFRGVV